MFELRMALRRLRRHPFRVAATALTLAIGVGATTAGFTSVDGVLLRDLPVERQDELVVAWRVSDRTPIRLPFSGVAFDALRPAPPGRLSAVAGYSAWGSLPVLVEDSDASFPLNASYVAGDFFGVLGARPAMGRLLGADDDLPDAAPSVVLSHSAWRQRFGADPAVVGSTIVMFDLSWTVVGVAPEGLEYPLGTELWWPLRADYANPPAGGGPAPELHLLGRVSDGAGEPAGATDIAAALAADPRTAPFQSDIRNVVRSLEDEIVGSVEPLLYAAFVAAFVLLLVAAANATLFLLAGGRGAAQDVAIRAALGAQRAHVLGRFLTDAAIVGILAAGGGIAVAWVGLTFLIPFVPSGLPRFDAVAMDLRSVLFALLVSGLLVASTGTVAGSVLSRLDVRGWLQSGGRRYAGGGSDFRRAAAAVQVGLTVLSAVGAGLLVRTVVALNAIDPGFSSDDMTTVSLQVPYGWFDVPEDYLVALEDVVRDLESRPGVTAARPSLGPPLQQRIEVTLRAEGQTDEQFRTNPFVAVDAVLPGHFEALGIPIRAGRGLTEGDNRPEAAPVVVVDEALAGVLWPGEDPMGKRLIGYPGLNETAFTVVGVVASTRYREFIDVHPRAYYPLRYVGNSPPAALLVRTVGPSVPVRDLVAAALGVRAPEVRVLDVRRLPEVLHQPTEGRRFAAMVLVSFAAATLVLALLGIYSVFMVMVQERIREMGIRRALGAQRVGIVKMVLGSVLEVASVGAAGGVALALWSSRLLGTLLYGVASTDPGTIATVVVGSLLLALAAGLIPALRACSVDPAISLRSE